MTAAAAAGVHLHQVLATPAFRARHPKVIRFVEQRMGFRCRLIAPERLEELADSDAPQGLAALAAPPTTWHSAGSDRAWFDDLPPGIHLYVDGIQDPGNMGALARSAEAAGAGALLLAEGSARPDQPRALRASAGSLLRLPTWTGMRVEDLPAAVRLIALVPRRPSSRNGPKEHVALFGERAPSRALRQQLAGSQVALAVGNESRGLSAAVLERADLGVVIETAAAVESLNATVAASLALFELRRLRSARR